METPTPAKTCTLCQACWTEYLDLVRDPALRVNGYQAYFDDPAEGLIFLTHEIDGCRSTVTLRARELRFLHAGPTIEVRNTGKPGCHGNCLSHGDLEPCAALCDMAWVRDVLQVLRSHEVPPHLLPPPGS